MSRIVILEPFYGGSHKQWADDFKKYSSHKIEVLSLKAHNWKWRMHGGAISLADKFIRLDYEPDWILASDMIDLTTFLALTRKKSNKIKTALYFHENQLAYPWSADDTDLKNGRDNHYKFINYVSALSADVCYFNSKYNMSSFLNNLPQFLSQFPDNQNRNSVNIIKKKCKVLQLGLDLNEYKGSKIDQSVSNRPVILWNHRWEYDKNPQMFFNSLQKLKSKGYEFSLVVLGQELAKSPHIFEKAKEKFKDEIVHWGFLEHKEDYFKWLERSHILPVTSNQDFFGGSIIEAVFHGVYPILPNRLAYPEHFSDPSIYYNSEHELLDKLEWAVRNYLHLPNYRDQIKHYAWKSCIGKYDAQF